MGKRRDGREAAVQFLYYRDLNPGGEALADEDFWALCEARAPVREFAANLARGVLGHRAEIDKHITDVVANYELGRIAAVDRSILRLAIYEMLFCEEVPPVVAINEAIEIAKSFGGQESGRFVNGVLDRIRQGIDRPARQPKTNPA